MVVGDGAVGKTCLVDAYGQNGFPSTYVPTVAKNFENKVEYQGKEVTLDIWDTGGQEEFRSVRPVSYNGADVFIVCFAVDEKPSLENACNKWLKELEETGPRNVARVLCCTKVDLRDQDPNNEKFISDSEGEAASTNYRFLSYVECSAITFKDCDTVFAEAVRTASLVKSLEPDQKSGAGKQKECSCTTF